MCFRFIPSECIFVCHFCPPTCVFVNFMSCICTTVLYVFSACAHWTQLNKVSLLSCPHHPHCKSQLGACVYVRALAHDCVFVCQIVCVCVAVYVCCNTKCLTHCKSLSSFGFLPTSACGSVCVCDISAYQHPFPHWPYICVWRCWLDLTGTYCTPNIPTFSQPQRYISDMIISGIKLSTFTWFILEVLCYSIYFMFQDHILHSGIFPAQWV